MAGEYKITLINENNKRFTKTFFNPIEYRRFFNKVKRSKKVTLVSWDSVPD